MKKTFALLNFFYTAAFSPNWACGVTFLFFSALAGICRADVDTGLDIRGRAYNSSNPAYTTDEASRNFFDQRTRFYLKGMLKENINCEMTIQNTGLWGQENNDKLFFERTNIKAEEFFSLPASVILGKQGCKIGEGLLVNDENTGLSGIKIDSRLPLGFNASAAAFKLIETSSETFSGGERDNDVYFATLGRKIFGGEFAVAYFTDVNKTSSTATQQTLIDIRYESAVSGELKWSWEFAKSIGDKKGLDTSALIVRVKAFGNIAKLGKGNAFLVYAKGKEGFKPSTSHIAEYEETGEYYMKNRESGRSNSIENLQLMGAGAKARTKFIPVDIFFNYFDYGLAAADLAGKTKLGRETDYGLLYSYTDNLKFRFVYSIFSPGEAMIENGKKNEQILFETNLFF